MKAIIFDFDGTLTQKGQNTWRMLWEKCGYSTDKNSLYAQLYVKHVIKKEITRKQWFDYTCKAFQEKGFTYSDLYEVSKKLKLVDGFSETVRALSAKGYKLFIVSGGITDAIEIALDIDWPYFEFVESNMCRFDKEGKLLELIPTDYDYEGKAKFIEVLKGYGFKAEDMIFIGNSDNDEFAHQAGCKTICINPENADIKNKTKWHKVYQNVTNLRQPFADILDDKINEDICLDAEK